jgi:hypothetical protein
MGQAMEQASQPPNGWSAFRNNLYQNPVMGDAFRSIGNVLNKANAGKEVASNPMNAGMAAAGGAGVGMLQTGEALGALAGRALPLDDKTRDAIGHDYKSFTGGKLPSEALGESVNSAFPDNPHSVALGELGGSLAGPGLGFTAVEKALLAKIAESPVGRNLVSKVAAKIAGSTATGAGISTAYNAGSNISQGKDPMEGAGTAAKVGGLLGAAMTKPGEKKKVSDVKKPMPESGMPGYDYWHGEQQAIDKGLPPKKQLPAVIKKQLPATTGQPGTDARAPESSRELSVEARRMEEPPMREDVHDAEDVRIIKPTREIGSGQETGPRRIGMDKPGQEPERVDYYHENRPSYFAQPGPKPGAWTEPTPEQIQRADAIRNAGEPSYMEQSAKPEPQPKPKKKLDVFKAPKQETQPLEPPKSKASKKKVSLIKETPAPKTEAPLESRVDEVAPAKSQAPTSDMPMKPADFNPPVQGSPEADNLYKELGKEPPPEDLDEPVDKNTHVARSKVDAGELLEKGDKGKYDKPFDTANPEPRPARWSGSGRIHVAAPHEEPGKARLGAIVDHPTKGGILSPARLERAKDSLTGRRNMGTLYEDSQSGSMTPEQQRSVDRLNEENSKGNTPKAQAEVMDIINSNNTKAAESFGDNAMKKLSGVVFQGGYSPITIPGLPQLMRGLASLAKSKNITLKGALETFGDDAPQALADTLKMHADLERIREGAEAHGDTIHDDLQNNIDLENLHTMRLGVKMEGKFGEEAREALRSEKPHEILDPLIHPGWTPDQRQYVATKKVHRMDSKKLIKATLQKHGGVIDPAYERALTDYSAEQYGRAGQGSTSQERWYDQLHGHLSQSIFRNNPKAIALRSFHPIQIGSAVSGPLNIATAYTKMATSAKWRKLMGVDLHALNQAGHESNHLIPEVPIDRFNNEIISGASMLKEARKIYGGIDKGLEAIDRLADGTLPANEALPLLTAASRGLFDATGGGSFGMNRSMAQRLPMGKVFKNYMGYKDVVLKYHLKLAKDMMSGDSAKMKEAFGSFAALQAATVLLGGYAVIPKQSEEPLAKIMGTKNLYGLEKALDQFNLLKKTGVDVSDHMQYSLLNWQESAMLKAVADIGKTAIHINDKGDKSQFERYSDALASLLAVTKFSAPLGVGVGTLKNVEYAGLDLAKGKKNLNIYTGSMKRAPFYTKEEHRQKLNIGDALYHIFGPGHTQSEGNERQQAKFRQIRKDYGGRLPHMQDDYPTPGIDNH